MSSNHTPTPTVIKTKSGHISYISPEDADLISLSWCKSSNYLYRRAKKDGETQNIFLHRVILERMLGRNLEKHEFVDHKDGNGFNNVRDNLRVATRSQNLANSKLSKRNRFGFKGVTRMGNDKKYTAQIKVNGKRCYLGRFTTPEEAHEAYCKAALEAHGEFARFK